MGKINRKQSYDLFNEIEEIAKEYDRLSLMIRNLKPIVQNPDFADIEDLKEWNEFAFEVSEELKLQLKNAMESLSMVYVNVNKLYKDIG